MWQTVIVLLVVAGVLIYLIRYYASVMRGKSSGCPSCADSGCAARSDGGPACECSSTRQSPFFDTEGSTQK